MKKFGLVLFAVLAALGWGGCTWVTEIPPLYGNFDRVDCNPLSGLKWSGEISSDGQNFLVHVNTWKSEPANQDFSFSQTDLGTSVFQDLVAVMNGQLRYNRESETHQFPTPMIIGMPAPRFYRLSNQTTGDQADISYGLILDDLDAVASVFVPLLP